MLIEEDQLAVLRSKLAAVRDELAWRRQGLDTTFHASEDPYEVRDAVFTELEKLEFRIDFTLLDKPKAPPQTTCDEPTFFQHAWYHHMKYLAPRVLCPGDELLVVAASIGTKKKRAAVRGAIEEVLKHQECVPFRVKRTLAFWRDESDYALQAVDYCTWAVTRKWEKGDDTYYGRVRDKLHSERDLWQNDTRIYY